MRAVSWKTSLGSRAVHATPLAGRTILLHAEQGAGDAIQFVRYAEIAARMGGKVILACPKNLKSLLAAAPGVFRVVSDGERLPPGHRCDGFRSQRAA